MEVADVATGATDELDFRRPCGKLCARARPAAGRHDYAVQGARRAYLLRTPTDLRPSAPAAERHSAVDAPAESPCLTWTAQ